MIRLRTWGRVALAAASTPIAAVVISLILGGLIMRASGVNPFAAYHSLFSGAFGSARAWGRTLQAATPLILTGIAVAFAFCGGLFNIGGDGQFAAGAVTAAWLGASLPLPPVLGPALAIAAAGVAGAVVGGIAGYLSARFSAHEVVTTIMLNFIVLDLANWLLLHPLSGHTQLPGSAMIHPGNALPAIGSWLPGVHVGFVIAILAAVIATVILWRTPIGLELRVSGLSRKAARYAGRSPVAAALVAMGGGGAFAGIAGAGEVLGTYGHMTVPFISGLGYLGIGVALLGRNHPLGCIAGGVILGGLSAGGQRMQFDMGVSSHFTDILVALILLCVTVTSLRFGAGSVRLSRRRGEVPR